MRKVFLTAAFALASFPAIADQVAQTCDPDQMQAMTTHYVADEYDKIVANKAIAVLRAENLSLKKQLAEAKAPKPPVVAGPMSRDNKAPSGGK